MISEVFNRTNILTNKVDIESFYKKGFSVCKMLGPESREISEEIVNNNTKRAEAYLREKTTGETPSKDELKSSSDRSDISVKDLCDKVLKSEITGDLKEIFDFEVVDLDVWEGVEDQKGHGLPWHWDGIDDSDCSILLYFPNTKVWKEEYGGCLQIGTISNLNGKGYGVINEPSDDEVYDQKLIIPEPRTVVFLNNKNPAWVHKASLIDHENFPEIRRHVMIISLNLLCKNQETKDNKVMFTF